jgi:[ribosomal protein S5]-alanine N-acetyltransferase
VATWSEQKLITKNGTQLTMRHVTEHDVGLVKVFLPRIAEESTHTLQYVGRKLPDDAIYSRRFIDDAADPKTLILGVFDDGRMVGYLTIRPTGSDHPWTTHIAVFGIMVLKEFWGQGIGGALLTAAEVHCKKSKFRRIEARVRTKNERALRLYQRFGFVIEGTRRAAALIDGELSDEYYIAKLIGMPEKVIAATRIPVTGTGCVLSDITTGDRAAYLDYLNEREIYERTLAIPFPYRDNDFDFWQHLVAKNTQANGRAVQFAIRNDTGALIGGIGFDGLVIGRSHQAELGYWLAKPFWGKGLMTSAVAALCEFAFSEFQLTRITAHIFAFNQASERVLLKNGFMNEGYFRKHYRKDGVLRDGKLFALVV